uniref:Melanoma cell adhesion molecule n=1 Tax=Gopherus evgoodei TaxID=1825980 RepID=A0A8C4YK60_9SAUR
PNGNQRGHSGCSSWEWGGQGWAGCSRVPGRCGAVLACRVEVSMLEMVEVELGQTARIPCNFSLPGESHYAYINWFYVSSSTHRGAQVLPHLPVDPEYKGRVAMENDFTLTISRVTLQDARTFVCQVGAGSLGVGENRTKLHIYKTPEPPEIQVNDAGIPVTSKEIPKIAVCVSKNGFPAPNITWYKNGSPLWQDDTRNILSTLIKESSGLYTVSSNLFARVSREDRQSRFHCEVSYRLLGTDQTASSEKVNVTVFYSTENLSLMIQSPQPQVREGDDVTLRCEGDGNPPPEYNLLKVQRDLPSSNGVLILRKVKKEDSGQYLCRTFDLDSMMKLEDTVELSVNCKGGPGGGEEAGRFPPGPVLSHSPAGERWHLRTAASGSPRGLCPCSRLAPGNQFLFCTSISKPLATRRAPRLIPVLALSLDLEGLKITPEGPIQLQQGEVVTLTCDARGSKPLEFRWKKEKVQNHTDHHRVISNLTVQVTSKLLQSGVTCTATNEVGNSSHHITLQLKQKTQESKGVIIVAVIVCILVIAVLGAVLYFLHKKGKIPCNRTGKQDITRPDARKDEIVVEVKSDKLPEETGLLQGANSEKRPAGDQAEKYIDLRN